MENPKSNGVFWLIDGRISFDPFGNALKV